MLKRLYYPRKGTTTTRSELIHKMTQRGWRKSGEGHTVAGKNRGEWDVDFTHGTGNRQRTVMITVSPHNRINRVDVDWVKKLR